MNAATTSGLQAARTMRPCNVAGWQTASTAVATPSAKGPAAAVNAKRSPIKANAPCGGPGS
eukprot:830293-Lingulodinium_polyedra.AAC.1